MSPLFAYSRHERTPWRSNKLTVGWGVESVGPCPRNNGRRGSSLGNLCSNASIMPGAEIEPVTKAIPTGSKGLGGRDLADNPAQKLWRSPDTVAKPVMP